MNLLEELDCELKNKHYNEFEKVRYIYLKLCKLFSFDNRFYYTYMFMDNALHQNIINRNIDVCNVQDFLVVCHSFSKEVLFKIINELTSANVKLHTSQHSYLVYEEKPGLIWKLDATFGDFSRVKLNLNTTGFLDIHNEFCDRLKEVDENLGYFYKEKSEYIEKLDLTSTENLMKSVQSLLQNSDLNKEYCDALFFVKWLLFGVNYFFSDYEGIDRDYNFYNFFHSYFDDSIYLLSSNNDIYGLGQLGKEECFNLVRSLKMRDKNLINYLE